MRPNELPQSLKYGLKLKMKTTVAKEDAMAIWVSSDWHCEPEQLKEAAVQWITLGKAGNHRLIGDGDLFDILPLGKKKWEQADSIEELAALLDGYPFDYVAGNHDYYGYMKKRLAPYANITVYRRLPLEEDGRRYFITHGHRWALDWGFLGLRRIAPWFVEIMVEYMPKPWYWLCRRLGWLASRPEPGASAGEERHRITKLIRTVWAGAADYALKNDCCVILGHTHTTGRRERGISRQAGFQAYMVDDGNLPDGTYVEITSDAALKFLP